jgi:hypothetical protein
MDNLFGPLGREYCIWFYFLSVLAFISLVLFLVPAVWRGISTKKDIWYFLGVFAVMFSYIIIYFQNRLLYSMCSGKMK